MATIFRMSAFTFPPVDERGRREVECRMDDHQDPDLVQPHEESACSTPGTDLRPCIEVCGHASNMALMSP